MINDEGGISGRKIEYSMFDDGYKPAKTKAGVKELQEGKGNVSGGLQAWGTSCGLAVKDYLMEKKIPWWDLQPDLFDWITPPRNTSLRVYPLYYTEAQLLVRYAVKKHGKKKSPLLTRMTTTGKTGFKARRRNWPSKG